MATLTIECTEENLDLYLEEVTKQFREGYTSGHVDSETYWSLDKEG
jgi:hypothetical protein